jgi:hypothetical protein
MAVGLPAKTTYADGDVFSASDINDTNGTLNLLNPTTKGSIVSASATNTPALLAVGNNGETLVADSSTSTGLRYQDNYAAGKNKIINGDFGVWQRGTTFNAITQGHFADRFLVDRNGSGATVNVTQQTFPLGTAPVAGYEGKFFARIDQTVAGSGATFGSIVQRIENVRTFAGQTVTLSFWAKANTNVSLYNVPGIQQFFGTGGSPSGTVTTNGSGTAAALTTSWQRFSYQFTLPSIAGKTIGTNNNDFLAIVIRTVLNTAITIDIWGWQLEAGSVATAFQTATGTIQGELAACQRYYWRTGGLSSFQAIGTAYAKSATEVNVAIPNPVSLRTKATSVDSSTLGFLQYDGTIRSLSSVTLDVHSSLTVSAIFATMSGSTGGYVGRLIVNNSLSGYIGFSAEL